MLCCNRFGKPTYRQQIYSQIRNGLDLVNGYLEDGGSNVCLFGNHRLERIVDYVDT